MRPEAHGWSAFDRELPRKRMAAAALLVDATGQLLMVKPVYRDHWDLPGGVVELNESPRQAVRREIAEELGLDSTPGALLCVDWVPPRPDRSEGLIMVFDGGMLEPDEIGRIRLQLQELAAYEFVDVIRAPELLPPHLRRRLEASIGARTAGRTVYLENGVPA
jgi:8-oxo-dGTP diphosphatase